MLILLLVVILLFVRSPWGQSIIVQKATTFVSKKTNTHVGIDRLFVTFRGDLYLEGLYLEDLNADTLIYSKRLETGLALWPLIINRDIAVSRLEWDGLTAYIKRDSVSQTFNFDFLLNAFLTEGDEVEEYLKPEDDPNVGTADERKFPNLAIGPIDLTDFKFKYDDEIMGIQVNGSWEKIHIKTDELDINKMNFGIGNIQISGADFDYFQYKPFLSSEADTLDSEIPLPLLVLENFGIQQSHLKYESIPEGIKAEISLGDFSLSLPEADLESQKIILKSLVLSDSNFALEMKGEEIVGETTAVQETTNSTFSWPDWWVEVGNITLENNELDYRIAGESVQPGVFNPNAIALSNLDFLVRNVFLHEQKASFNLEKVSFEEGSGLVLENLEAKLKVDEQRLSIDGLVFKSGKSFLEGDVSMNYQSLSSLINSPESASFDVRLRDFQTNASEALFFVPELAREIYFKELLRNPIKASGQLNGSLAKLSISSFDLKYGKQTSLSLRSANFTNLTEPDKLRMNVPKLKIQAKGDVLEPFLSDLGYNLPDEILLDIKATGGMKDLQSKIQLNTSDGNVTLQADLEDKQKYVVESTLALDQFDLGKILNLPDLKPITLAVNLNGNGTGLDDLEGLLTMDIDSLAWTKYDLSELKFQMETKDKEALVAMGLHGEFLDFDFDLKASLDTLNPGLNFFLDLRKLETLAFGLTKQDINAKLKINGSLEGDFDDFEAFISIEEGMFFNERRAYPLGRVVIQGALSEYKSKMGVRSDFLTGDFSVNGSLANLNQSMGNYFEGLIMGTAEDFKTADLEAEAAFWFHPTPFIDQLFLAGIDELDTTFIEFGFDSKSNLIRSEILIPHVNYDNAALDTFRLSLKGDSTSLKLESGFKGLLYDPIDMGETRFTATFENQLLEIGFSSKSDTATVLQFFSEVRISGDTLRYHILPKDLIFNSRKWEVPENNLVTYANKYLKFQDFSFLRNGQELNISNDLPNVAEEHIGIKFKDFRLATFLSFLNPEDPLVQGIANGELVMENPFEAIGLLADVDVKDFKVIDIPLGRLDLHAEAKTLREYDFDLSLKEGDMDLDLRGTFLADSVDSNLNMKLDINALQITMLEALSGGAIKDGKGYIAGEVILGGTVKEPVYKGEIKFKDAGLLVTDFNTRFLIPDEKFTIDNQGLIFKDFRIRDENGNAFVTNGKIITEELSDIGFDLKLATKGFQVLNSTRADNDLFFGKANVDLDMSVGGSIGLPEVTVKLKVNKNSNVTFIVPEDQLDVIERTGVVIFVNQKDPYDILYQREMDISTKGIQGYDVRANLQIDPQSVFNVIVDERTGDNLRLQGEADLNMLMNPNGDISLSGRYEVKSGHYELNLFGLVNRRFELAGGSSVIWNGDPMDASLDLRAIYNIRTSAAELMQAQLSGTEGETRGQFRQVFNFMVYLKIGGDLLKPEISFELDMAEQERGAFGGSVYGMIQQVNEQEDELTKQVFALLVLNQFFPMMGNDGASGGSVNLARSSVSQVLSSQLNAFSDRLFGESGFSLDFDLDSYTDYQSSNGPADRTQLNVAAKQRLMDDRLVISVGGQVDVEGGNQNVNQGDALFGDVSVEYLLDKRGQWRAKAYRKNQFESVIDGQLIVTGISLIFNKEFNAFKELWRKSVQQNMIKKEEESASDASFNEPEKSNN